MDPLTNLTSIRGDTIELWDAAAERYVGIQELLVGIAPSDMNTISKVAGALDNDPDFFRPSPAG